MLGIILALFSAFASGLSAVLVRKRIMESHVLNVTFVTCLVGNLILWPIALLITDLTRINLQGVIILAIAGILAPGIGRLFYLKGIEAIGASVTTSIWATYPLYTTIFAILFLNEVLSFENWIGIACIIFGVFLIERTFNPSETGKTRHFKKGLLIPILGTLFISSSSVIRKYGLSIYNEPVLGVAIGYAFSLPTYLIFLTISKVPQNVHVLKKDLRLFWKAGAGTAIGFILSFYAVSLEKVSIIAPLLQVNTLFVILISYLYLKELEKISREFVISAIIIVLGVLFLVR